MRCDLPQEPSKTFEIDIVIKDSAGNPTNRRKSYASNDVYNIWKFWMRNQGRPKRKRRIENTPSKNEADKIVSNLYKNEDDDENLLG